MLKLVNEICMHILNSKLTVNVPHTHMHHVLGLASSLSIMPTGDPSRLFVLDSFADIAALLGMVEGIGERTVKA